MGSVRSKDASYDFNVRRLDFIQFSHIASTIRPLAAPFDSRRCTTFCSRGNLRSWDLSRDVCSAVHSSESLVVSHGYGRGNAPARPPD
jgi:hypothetical protein